MLQPAPAQPTENRTNSFRSVATFCILGTRDREDSHNSDSNKLGHFRPRGSGPSFGGRPACHKASPGADRTRRALLAGGAFLRLGIA